jgi:hypothetical protein
MTINRGAQAAAAPNAAIPVRSNVLLPPAPIPNVGDPNTARAGAVPHKDKSLLDKLFGGA